MVKLFILLTCLGIERYLHIGSILNRFNWFDVYANKLGHFFPNNELFKGYLGIFLLILPICGILGLFYLLVTRFEWGLSGAGISFIILLYCFGPIDLHGKVYSYLTSLEKKDLEVTAVEYRALTGESIQTDEHIASKKVTEAIFVQGNDNLFAVIVWYVLLGPIAVLLYRLIFVAAKMAAEGKPSFTSFGPEVVQLNKLLSWLPARVASLFYILTNGFQNFGVWRSNALSTKITNEECLITCGMVSLPKNNEELHTTDEPRKALAIVDRAIIIALVVVALFVLGSWIR